jgi:hypothetical protein
MQDFAARLQRHLRCELFLFMLAPKPGISTGLLRDLPKFPDQQNGNKSQILGWICPLRPTLSLHICEDKCKVFRSEFILTYNDQKAVEFRSTLGYPFCHHGW